MRFTEQSEGTVMLDSLVCGRWPNILQPSHPGDLLCEKRVFLAVFLWDF